MRLCNSNPCNDYVLDGSKLEVVDAKKDLGLLISEDLKWDEQDKSSLCITLGQTS